MKVIKKGTQSGRQRYLCLICSKHFQSKKRSSRLRCKLWNEYVYHRQTLRQLSERHKKSVPWIRKQLQTITVCRNTTGPSPVVIVADSTFFKRAFGLCVFRAPHIKRNLYWAQITTETIDAYRKGRMAIEAQGFQIKAIVLDGRPGIRELFSDIPVQMCHFHQRMIIHRYLTGKPKLNAGIELKNITATLCKTTKTIFESQLHEWHEKWNVFLKEKTVDSQAMKWFYTHRRLRAAYRSLITNMPFLFTYKEKPDLKIPNTTNSLDGSFAHLKQLIGVHRGLNIYMKLKAINQYLDQ